MRFAGLAFLLIVCVPAEAAPPSFQGALTVAYEDHFQGIRQNDRTSISAGIAGRATKNLSAGVWLGEFRVPYYEDASGEIDYFVRFTKQLAFGHRIDTSLWRYTYTNPDYRKYDWSQWLTSYHLDERFTFTVGVSKDFLLANRLTTFAEITARHNFGRMTAAFSLGRNDPGDSPLNTFEYGQFKIAYSMRHWHLYADYTQTIGIDDATTRQFAHQGLSVGISRAFRQGR